MARKKSKSTELSNTDMLKAIGSVLKISFKISPSAIGFKFIGSVLDAVLPLLTAFLAAQTITEITRAFAGESGAREAALLYVFLTAGVGLLTTIKGSLTNYIDQIVRFKVESRVSDMLYERFSQLDFWRYEDKATTDLYDKAQDFSRFFAYVFDRIAQLMTSLFSVGAAIAALSIVSPWLSIALLAAILPGMVVQYKLSRFQIKHWRETVTARRKKNYIEYNMMHPEAISELRLYNLANTMLKLRKKYRDIDQGARLRFERKFLKWRALSDGLETAVQLGSLLWVVLKIANRQLPIGQFVYVQQLVSTALGSAGAFISQYGASDEDLAKLRDYNEFMRIPLLNNGTRKVTQLRSIEFKDVSFSYPGATKQVLKNINLSIREGQHVAIVGENGAGKSTLIKLLLRLYEPTSGEILVNGHSLREYDIASWHKLIGVLRQEFARFHFLTLGENVTYGNINAKRSAKRLSNALAAAEATDVIDDAPMGLDTPMGTWWEEEGGTDLSGGQWQRIALARNFYRRAPLVILDEPTSAIDALAESKIFDRLFDASNQNTLIAISHRLTTIEGAENIYVLKDGQVVQQGVHDELAAEKSGQYATMFRRQLKNDR